MSNKAMSKSDIKFALVAGLVLVAAYVFLTSAGLLLGLGILTSIFQSSVLIAAFTIFGLWFALGDH